MKKFNYLLLGATGLLLASCANEDLVSNVSNDGKVNVSITLTTPVMNTRAYSDGTTATQLQYAVYVKNADGTLSLLSDHTHTSESINLKKQVSLRLVTNRTYGFVFWAANSEAPYTVTFGQNGASMSVDYTKTINANNETLDAFYAYEEFTVTQDIEMDIDLYRPFAQINVGASDIEDAKKSGYTPATSHINISDVYGTLNLITGEVTNKQANVEFGYNAIPSAEKFPVNGYDYITMAYALVPNDKQTVEVSFDTKSLSDEVAGTRKVGSVPVQRNYRTNIYGQLFTSNVDIYVEIVPIYNDPDYIINLDGVEYDPASDTFTVTSPKGLLWVSRAVGGFATRADNGQDLVKTGQYTYGAKNVAFVGQTVTLGCDIDLQGIDWYPIGFEVLSTGASEYAFAGTFDGKGYTISNLTIPEGLLLTGNSNAGLFGATNRATIKNVTLSNVNIHSHYKTGAIVGDGYNARIENCHVKGGTITVTPWEKKTGVYDDANNVGGIVGYLIGQPEDAYVRNSTVDGLKITAFRKVGGIAGVASCSDDKNPHECYVEISGCSVENTNITADMTEIHYTGFASQVADIGTIYGIKSGSGTINLQEGNSTETQGTVTITVKTAKVDAAGAAGAISKGGNIYLTEDANSQNGYTMTKDTNIDLNNNSLSATSNGTYGDNIVIGNGAIVTISNGEIKPADNASVANASATILVKTASESHLTLNNVKATGIYPVYLNSANENSSITINGGEYYTTMPLEGVSSDKMAPAVYVGKGATGSTIGGKVTIYGGTFGSKGVINNFLLNIEDVLRQQEGKEPRNFIEVFGGKFYNFDPSNNKAEGVGTNFVADGFKVISYKDGSDTIYEVVPK